ncbi:uncharacterized protein LOC103524116 [Trichonephila clavipes]|nr:uncharacterized protein LOC103524116 [Trichonephila clavipes]
MNLRKCDTPVQFLGLLNDDQSAPQPSLVQSCPHCERGTGTTTVHNNAPSLSNVKLQFSPPNFSHSTRASYIILNCRELLGKIKGKIVFQWVPSHCGLWGNETVDFLAKKGTGILQNFRRDLTLHSAKLEIKRIFRESFRLTASRDKPWSTLCKKSHGIPSSPRAAAVAKFRLLTGHDCLCAHLFRFNLVTSPICVLCDTGQDMTAAHLDECSALNDLNCIVKRYWRARCLMT